MLDSHEEFVRRMVTEDRAFKVALRLFPDNYAAGTDCRLEYGREGQPCNVCAARNETWAALVVEVRNAMLEAFR